MTKTNTAKIQKEENNMSMKIDHEAIKNLATVLNDTGLTEIEITQGDSCIRVTKNVTVQAAYAPQAMPQFAPQAAAAAPAAAETGKVAAISADNHPGAVKSPMVGTAYAASSPGAAPFISKGQTVKAGDTLMIIEAMKVMNPIKAEKGGTVADILFSDAEPVEFGQVLVIIE